MCKVVGEDERLAHALDGKQPVLGIVLSACKKDLSSDTGTDGSDKMENVVLARSVRERKKRKGDPEKGILLWLRSGAAASWKG